MFPTRTPAYALLAALLTGFAPGPAQAEGPTEPVNAEDFGIGPHCGLYATFVAISSIGDLPRKTLVHDAAYLSSPTGSTGADLCRAITDQGYTAQPLSDLSAQSLLALNQPAILHFRTVGSTDYEHWVTFLGFEDGKFKVYDPPKSVVHLTEAELLSLWDGYAVVVSKDGMGALSRTGIRVPHVRLLLTAFLALVASAVLTRRGLSTGWAVYILLPAICVGLTAVQLALPGSPVWNSDTVRLCVPQSPRYKAHPEIATAADLAEFARANPCVLVDARPDHAYRLQRVPGAVSLPIGSSLAVYRALLDQHPADTTFVVFCQSKGCTWAEHVATGLRTFGVERVYVYRGGYNDYELATAKKTGG
ncbi:MAG TPA: rhodanese-like domain-containing protein [Urbifossiella sp.]|nr:rhodanese-like domain-containing protein [Urbifossiella sp.]